MSPDARPIRVTQFRRRPHQGMFSIERVFDRLLPYYPPNVSVRTETSRFESHGIFRRVYNMIEAFFRRGDVNHVTGDVHFLTFLLPKRRTVLTNHHSQILNGPRGPKWWLAWFFWYRLPARRSRVITTVSHFTKQELLGYLGCPPEKVRVVYNPLSPSYTPRPAKFNGSKPRILQIGVKPNKNVPRLLEALKDIPCHLRIIGFPPEELSRVLRSTGVEYSCASGLSEEEMIGEYERCDLVAYVSFHESFGLPLVEGNAIGRPVVGADATSTPEIAGDAACLVDPFDVKSIREGILRVARDDAYRERLVENGFRNAKRFLPEKIAADYTRIYEEIASDAP